MKINPTKMSVTMNQDLLDLPSLEEVKELISAARTDIAEATEQEPESAVDFNQIAEVVNCIDELAAKHSSFENLSIKDRIALAAHLCFLDIAFDIVFFSEEDECEDDECEDDECDSCDDESTES
jgi:hypothetical protein